MNKNKKLLSFMMGLALVSSLKTAAHAWGSDSGGYDDSGYGSGSGDNGAINLEGLGNPTNGWGGESDTPNATILSDLPSAPDLPAVEPSAPSDVPSSIADLPSAPAPAVGTPNTTVAAIAPTIATVDASADIHAGNAPAPTNPWTLPAAPPPQPALADAAPVQPTIVTAMVGGASNMTVVNQQAVVKNGVATFSANGTAVASNAPNDGGYGLTTSPNGLQRYAGDFAGPVGLPSAPNPSRGSINTATLLTGGGLSPASWAVVAKVLSNLLVTNKKLDKAAFISKAQPAILDALKKAAANSAAIQKDLNTINMGDEDMLDAILESADSAKSLLAPVSGDLTAPVIDALNGAMNGFDNLLKVLGPVTEAGVATLGFVSSVADGLTTAQVAMGASMGMINYVDNMYVQGMLCSHGSPQCNPSSVNPFTAVWQGIRNAASFKLGNP